MGLNESVGREVSRLDGEVSYLREVNGIQESLLQAPQVPPHRISAGTAGQPGSYGIRKCISNLVSPFPLLSAFLLLWAGILQTPMFFRIHWDAGVYGMSGRYDVMWDRLHGFSLGFGVGS